FNLNSRYIENDLIEKSLPSRKKQLRAFRRQINALYRDIVDYEHKRNNDLEEKYASIRRELKLLEKSMSKRIKIVTRAQATGDALLESFRALTLPSCQDNTNLNSLTAAVHDF